MTETAPPADARTVEPAADDPRPSAVRAILTADSSAMTGLAFEGIVTHETAAGDVRALRFTADSNALANMRIDLTQAGQTFRTTTNGTTHWFGHVVMDVTLLKATLHGEPVEFTPDTPPQPDLISPEMTFADMEIHLVLAQADQMIVPGNNQSFVS